MRQVTCSWCKGEGTIPLPGGLEWLPYIDTPTYRQKVIEGMCAVCGGSGKLKINLEVDEE